MAKIKNILSLTNILQSNVADFLSIGIEIAYILKEEKANCLILFLNIYL